MLLLLIFLPYLVSGLFIQKLNEKCTSLDHQDCDDKCKLANFLSGVCSYYDGYSELTCKCYQYENGLNADTVCTKMEHEKCQLECRGDKGDKGGYCYPEPSRENPQGVAKCACIK